MKLVFEKFESSFVLSKNSISIPARLIVAGITSKFLNLVFFTDLIGSTLPNNAS